MINASLQSLDLPRLADWGFNVTLCAAILSESRSKIAIVTDMKMGLGPFSADFVTMKVTPIRNWAIMYAGDDVESVPFIIESAHSLLWRPRKSPTPQEVAQAVDQAYSERLRNIIDTKVLRRFNYTSESFRKQAKRLMTASVYNSICARISDIKLKLRFLITGFDEHGKGHILVAGNDEPPTDYTELGFFAIGSAAPAALSSLLYQKTKMRMPPPDVREFSPVFSLRGQIHG